MTFDLSFLEIYKASAGSGKTHQLAHQYLKLSLKNPDNYDRILAVTFTNDATSEMKERIVSELKLLAKGEPSNHTESLLKELDFDQDKLKKRAHNVLINILHNYSKFSINTIDSFVQKIIRTFILDLGVFENYSIELNTPKVISEISYKLYKRLEKDKRLRNWLIQFSLYKISEGKSWIFEDEVMLLCKEVIHEKPFDIKTLYSGKEKDDIDLFKKELVSIKKTFENKITYESNKALEHIHLKLGDSPKLSQNFGYLYSYLKKCSSLKSPTELDYKRTKTVIKCISSFENWHKKNETDEIKNKILIIYNQVLQSLIKIVELVDKSYLNYLTAVELIRNFYAFAIIDILKDELSKYRDSENVLLISDTHQLLNEVIKENHAPFIYERAGLMYDYFLIDEFQDTSRLQWSNFKPLIENSLSEGNYNMIVGDVKQSVYRWRGGDWNLLLNEVGQGLSGFRIEKLSLYDNFRSKKEIIDFNNIL